MNRIVLILLTVCCLTGLLLAVPRPVAAEPLLAAIVTADLPRYKEAHKALAQILEAGGFGAGKLKIMVQAPNAD